MSDQGPVEAPTAREPADAVVGSPWPSRLVALLVAASVVGNGVWLHRERNGGPLDIDEASYLSLAFLTSSPDHRIVTGPLLLWQYGGHQGPLLPVVSGALHYVFGRSIFVSHLTTLVFLALLIVATYLLARRFTSGWWALLAALVVATAPGLVDYARHYHFAVPSAAMFTCCLVALLRSEHLEVRRWSLVFGAGLGLLLLSRTLMVAFTPGLVLAALVTVPWSAREQRRMALRHLALAGGLALVVAGSWYVFSAGDVWAYLTDFGYGAESTTYGVASIWSLRFWAADPVAVVSDGLYLPVALVLVAGAALGALTRRRAGTRRRLMALARTDAGLVLIALTVGWAALWSSRNEGSGFVLPLLPAAVVLAVALVARARPRTLAATFASVLVVLCAFNAVMKADVVDVLRDERAVTVSDLPPLWVVDGRSLVGRYVELVAGLDGEREGEGWDEAGSRLLRLAIDHPPAEGGEPNLLLLVEGPMLNSSALHLLVERGDPPGVRVEAMGRSQVDEVAPAAHGDDGWALLTAFLVERREAGMEQVVTGPGSLSWEWQRIPEAVTIEAAEAAGFRPVGEVALPDGSRVVLWSS